MLQLAVLAFIITGNSLVAFIVLQRNMRSATHILIAILALLLTGWTVANYLALSPNPELVRLFWVRVVMVITSPFGVVVFLLSSVFPGNKYTVSRRMTAVMLGLVAVTMVLATTPLVFLRLINFSDGNFSLIPGVGIVLFAVSLIVFTTWGFVRFVRKMLGSKGVLRNQYQLVTVGMMLSFSFIILTNFLAVILFQSVRLTFFGPPLTLIMVGSMTFAVMKHQFLGIRMTIVRSISFSILIGFTALMYSLLLFGLTRLFLKEQITPQATIISALIVFPVLLSFESLKKIIQKITEKLFYKYTYDLDMVVQELAQAMSSTLDLSTLLAQIILLLQIRVKISFIKIGLIQDNELRFYINGKLLPAEEHSSELLKLSQYASSSSGNMLVFEALEEGPLKQKMRELEVEVILALETKDALLGSVFLYSKRNGESYSPQDIQLLKIVNPQLSVAVQNAQSFNAISKFNITLRDEVDEATKELQAANTRLKELDKLKDQFVSLASHELRTPLTAIKSYLWMAISGKGGEINEKQRFYLERSANATERLIKLVNDMLNISRIEAGRIGLEVIQVDMEKLCADVIEEVKPRADELGLQLVCESQKSAHSDSTFQVVADADKIKEVLINLIGNSMKFTPKGGRLTVSLESKAGMIITHVTDTGVGISAENMKNLFQKFDLMSDSYQPNQDVSQGTGLGLFICKSIITLHHGTIWAESLGKGHGAKFSFSLVPFSAEKLALLQKENQNISDKAEIIHNEV